MLESQGRRTLFYSLTNPSLTDGFHQQVRFGQVKRKLGIWSDNGGAKSSPKKTKTPLSTPTKVTKTPTKRGAAKARMSKMKKEDDYDDEDNKEDASKNESDTDGGSVAKQEETDAGLNDPF